MIGGRYFAESLGLKYLYKLLPGEPVPCCKLHWPNRRIEPTPEDIQTARTSVQKAIRRAIAKLVAHPNTTDIGLNFEDCVTTGEVCQFCASDGTTQDSGISQFTIESYE